MAMTETPWTIKRKAATPVSFTGRKRQRRNDTPANDSRRQQTLTQAQWVRSTPSFSEDVDMTPLPESKTFKRKPEKARVSTLTQMEFFEGHAAVLKTEDLELINDDGNYKDVASIPQVDGTYHQSPRRPRKRKPVPVLKTEGTESQEYMPTKKSRRQSVDQRAHEPRRTSRRLADKVLSDPADNLEFFKEALTPDPTMPSKLEIQDSTADTEIFDLTAESPVKTPVWSPKRHDGTTVPSSQTPDSITRSTRRSSARVPLAELSTNLQAAPSPPTVYTPGKYKLAIARNTTLKKPARSPVCPTVEDSQSNLWSLKATSPIAQQSSAHEEYDVLGSSPPLPVIDAALEGTEIPATSQNDPSHSMAPEQMPADTMEKTSPAESQPPGPIPDSRQVSEEGQLAAEVTEARVVAHEVEDTGSPVPVPRTKELELSNLSSQYVRMAVNFAVPHEDEEDSDFGSPIRNDTQFNHEVEKRTSSPLPPSSRPASAGHDTARKPPAVSHVNPVTFSLSSLHQNGSGSSTESLALPPTPPPAPTTSHPGYVTSRVPLNDTAPSSSPPVQATNTKSTTQRSIRPASMAHPSQISTQEATQFTGYGGSSLEPLETPRAPQKVTIKDSSSVRRSISQIPRHVSSQPEFDIDLDFGALGDAEQEEVQANDEEYDLDPPSSGVVPAPSLPTERNKLPVAPVEAIPTEKLYPSSPSPADRPRGTVGAHRTYTSSPSPLHA
jgi:hypothetical protein